MKFAENMPIRQTVWSTNPWPLIEYFANVYNQLAGVQGGSTQCLKELLVLRCL